MRLFVEQSTFSEAPSVLLLILLPLLVCCWLQFTHCAFSVKYQIGLPTFPSSQHTHAHTHPPSSSRISARQNPHRTHAHTHLALLCKSVAHMLSKFLFRPQICSVTIYPSSTDMRYERVSRRIEWHRAHVWVCVCACVGVSAAVRSVAHRTYNWKPIPWIGFNGVIVHTFSNIPFGCVCHTNAMPLHPLSNVHTHAHTHTIRAQI